MMHIVNVKRGYPVCRISSLHVMSVWIVLFLSQEYLDRYSVEVKMLPQLVFQESLVVVPDVLRKIAEECERRRR